MAQEAKSVIECPVSLPVDLSDEDRKVFRDACDQVSGSEEPFGELLERRPDVLDKVAGPAWIAERAIVQAHYGGNIVLRARARRSARKIREDIAQAADGSLEKLLAGRVSLCWLALTLAEQQRASNWEGGIETRSADFWDRHVSHLNRDFLRASKTLATVRRLRLPGVQVNIAEQQVNVAR
jgi:hypothetical protein